MKTKDRFAHSTIAGSLLPALAAGALMGACSLAAAAEDNSLRVGAYFVQYNVHAQDVSGRFVPSGVNLDVKDLSTAYFGYVRRLSPQWDLEFAAGVPPVTKTVGKGPATLGSVPYAGQEIGTSKWFAPTVLLEYKFLDESSAFRPFVGLGVNYTHFYDNNSTAAGNAANGGPTSISLSDSVGAAGTVGFSYRVQGPWHVYGSYSMSQVRSNLTATTAGLQRRTTIDFRPSAAVVSVGYSF